MGGSHHQGRAVNPWGITDDEAAFMDALCELGNVELASDAVSVNVHTGRERLRSVRYAMAGVGKRRKARIGATPIPAIVACIRWAQWTAEHAEWPARVRVDSQLRVTASASQGGPL